MQSHERTRRFQFHTGSIKRRVPIGTSAAALQFQFHTGSIKSKQGCLNCLVPGDKFQFHTGSIKR